MATTAALCDSFKTELLGLATHVSTDTYKIALYTSAAATLNKSTTAYTATGEITGTGYTPGGMALSGLASSLDTDTGILTFSNPSWTTATITADTALIYNSSKSNKAVAVLTFTSATSTAGTLTVQMPAATAAAGLIRIA